MEGYDEDDHHEELTIAGSRTSLDEDEGSGGAPKILRYNDDLEELNRFGVFRYAVYPFKVSMKYFKGKAEFCRRRKPNYVIEIWKVSFIFIGSDKYRPITRENLFQKFFCTSFENFYLYSC